MAVEGFQMTEQGLHKLGSGTVLSTGVKLHGEESGSSTIQGKTKDVAKKIAEELRPRFAQQG